MKLERKAGESWWSSTNPVKGFTLLELLLAVAIAAFVLSVSYSFFNAVERTGKVALENSKVQSLIPPIFYLLLRDVNSINLSYGSPKIVRDTDGNVKWFEFFTENCYYFDGICRVKYWIFKKGKEHWLIRTESRINSALPGVDFPVSSKISGFEVFKLSGGSWVKGVNDNLVKIVLMLEGEGEVPFVFKIRS